MLRNMFAYHECKLAPECNVLGAVEMFPGSSSFSKNAFHGLPTKMEVFAAFPSESFYNIIASSKNHGYVTQARLIVIHFWAQQLASSPDGDIVDIRVRFQGIWIQSIVSAGSRAYS